MKEIFKFSLDDLKTKWGLFATLFGIVSVVVPDFKIYFFLFFLFICWSVWLLFSNWKLLKQKVIDVEPRSNRNFYIMVDDFIENFKYKLQHLDKEDKSFSVALGIDQSLDLSKVSSGSMLEDFLVYLQNEHQISKSQLQLEINAARQKQISDKIVFGDIVHVPMRFSEKEVNLLFVVNSYKKEVDSIIRNNLIEGEDSRIIIIKLFKKCRKLKLSTLMLGAIGTNKLEFPYKIIITEIINAYVYCVEKGHEPKRVYLSLREQDMNEQELESREIISYITQAMKFNSI